MKKVLSLLLAAALVFGLAACTQTTPTTKPSDPATNPTAAPTKAPDKPTEKPTEAPTEPAEPKILHLYETATPATAWYATSSTAASGTLASYINGLLYSRMPVDGKAVLVPELADGEPIDVNGDGMTWNIKIKANAKFENGEPINADTFMYTFQKVLDPKLVNSNGSALATNYITIVNGMEYYSQGTDAKSVKWEEVGFKKIDDLTFQLITTAPVNASLVMKQFTSTVTAPVYPPLFEKCMAADGLSCNYGTTNDRFVSSGFFKVGKWEDGAVYEFVVNENHPLSDLIKLDGVTLSIIPDASTRLQLFEKDELDYIALDTAGQEKYGDDPRVLETPGRRVYSIEFCSCNTDKPILANENFRLALYYAVNRVEMAKLQKLTPATGLIGKTSVALDDGTTFRELAKKAGYEPANEGYDPVKAKAYFDKAMQEEGLTSLELTCLVNNGERAMNFVEILQQQWAKVFGEDKFKLNMDAQTSSAAGDLRHGWKTNVNSYEITMTQWNFANGDDDPIAALKGYTTTYSSRNAPYEYKELNAWYAEANEGANRLNMTKRNELAMKMEQYMIDHAIVIPLNYESSQIMVSERLILPVEEYVTGFGFGLKFSDIEQ